MSNFYFLCICQEVTLFVDWKVPIFNTRLIAIYTKPRPIKLMVPKSWSAL